MTFDFDTFLWFLGVVILVFCFVLYKIGMKLPK